MLMRESSAICNIESHGLKKLITQSHIFPLILFSASSVLRQCSSGEAIRGQRSQCQGLGAPADVLGPGKISHSDINACMPTILLLPKSELTNEKTSLLHSFSNWIQSFSWQIPLLCKGHCALKLAWSSQMIRLMPNPTVWRLNRCRN